jgi:flagellar hook-basal body complex protein FliE
MIGAINNFNGHVVKMNTTNPLHYSEKNIRKIDSDDVSTSFQKVFMNALNKVNNLQADSEELTQKMIYEPETVDIHQVMIANQKAEIALTFTKSVRDEAIRAYRDLINLR